MAKELGMMTLKDGKFSLIIFLLGWSSQTIAQQNFPSISDTILHLDSLLFSVGFNTHNIAPFQTLMAEDCEFYHDQSGFSEGRSTFIDGLENGLFKLDYLATRQLIRDSTKIFPLYNDGNLYGAIQNGVHEFFATYSDGKKVKTSTARFTHLWLYQNQKWLLSRILSFDHQQP